MVGLCNFGWKTKLNSLDTSTAWPLRLFRVAVCLLLFHVLATSKAISGWTPTCYSAHSWKLYSAALLGNQAVSIMTCHPTQWPWGPNLPISQSGRRIKSSRGIHTLIWSKSACTIVSCEKIIRGITKAIRPREMDFNLLVIKVCFMVLSLGTSIAVRCFFITQHYNQWSMFQTYFPEKAYLDMALDDART